MTQLLEVHDLSITTEPTRRAPAVQILDRVSFAIPEGEIVAIVGESGSGKTMSARAAMGLLPRGLQVTGGGIRFRGIELTTLPTAQMRKLRGAEIGMVFQEPMVSLNPAMTIGAQLTEALRLHQPMPVADAEALAVAMLTRVQIKNPQDCLAAFPHQFSGGMRQRIMLASVMLLRPKLLIADEPTTALDTLAQREVLELMVELTRDSGTAVMLITHNLGLVAQYASQVVVLERGKLVECGRVSEVLSAPKMAYTRKLLDALPRREVGREPPPAAPPIIAAEALEISYGAQGRGLGGGALHRVVHGVSVEVRPGEVVALVGGSGSGKTTLGRAMLGLVPHQAGAIRFRGREIVLKDRTAEARDFRLNCQLVFQDPFSSLDPRQTVLEIVAEPLELIGLAKRERHAKAQIMLAEVGLDGLGGRYPHQLSGGQRQRVAIARAVVRNPAFIVADEPVSALDMTVQQQVLQLFRKLQGSHGFGCLFISHDFGAVSQVSDRVIVMQSGVIVEQGSVAEVLDNPQHDYTKALLAASPSLAVPA